MTKNQIAVCKLLGNALFKVPFQENNEIDWNEVFCEMSQQKVQGLVFNSLAELNIPIEVRERWKNDVRKIVMTSTNIKHAQNELVSLLEKEKIHYIILKGTAIAAYYPEPRLRTMGDVDLYVPQNHYNQAIELMREKGYFEIKHESENSRHVCFMKDKVTFEVHRTYATVNSFEQRAYVDRLIDKSCIKKSEGIRDIGWVQYHDYGMAFRMPSITVNGIIVLEHIAHHLMYGIGLRQIIDWFIFAEKFLSDEHWPSFCDEARKAGLEKLAKVITRMGQLYFGLSSEITWCRDVDVRQCQELINYLFSNGDFGKKQAIIGRIATVRHNAKGIKGFFVNLQVAGEHNWKAYKKHHCLKPIVWIYQLVRYVCQIVMNPEAKKKLLKGIIEGKKRERMMDSLGVYRMTSGEEKKRN